MVKPITPDSVLQAKAELFPDEVIKVFNQLIAENVLGGQSIVKQSEAVERILTAMSCTREDVYTKNWLDIEDLYREAGWKVEYDKPAYNEVYPATFTFSKP